MQKDSKKSESNEFSVMAVRFWSSANGMVPKGDFRKNREVLGWLPMIFGPNIKGVYGLLASAVYEVNTAHRDPDPIVLYKSKEDAMAAWESGKPVPMDMAEAIRCCIPDKHIEIINASGLVRSIADDVDDDNPFDDDEVIEF